MYVPKYPYGHIPGKEFIDLGGTAHGFRIGVIQRIDEINMRADIKVITGGGFRTEIELTQALYGPRSFWGGVPEVGSLVILGYREISKANNLGEAMILGFLPTGNKSGLRFDPFSPSDPSEVSPDDQASYKKQFGGTIRYKRFKLTPGDVGGMSASGAELVLNRSVSLTNRAGDLIELRDEERSIITQTIHRFDADAGVRRYSGPVRRQVFFLPPEVFTVSGDTKTLKTEQEGYFGRDDLQNTGPGEKGDDFKYANSEGVLLDTFNNQKDFPSVTYTNGKTVFYPSTTFGVSLEGPIDDGAGAAYTEVRTEIAHETNLIQEVHTEIDGFSPTPTLPYIEHVMGTVVGNDAATTMGIKQYGQALRPQLWSQGKSMNPGTFTMETVARPAKGDLEVNTAAAAYLLRIFNPAGVNDGNPFAFAVQKQGKLLLQVPKPTNEFYGDSVKGVSADINLQGALKLFVGKSAPTDTSIYAKLDGGIKAEIGRNTDTGQSLDITFFGPVKHKFAGVQDANGNGLSTEVTGNYDIRTTGDFNVSTGGGINFLSNGAVTSKGDKIVDQALNGYTINAGGFQKTILGNTFLSYGLLKTETIIAGGEVKTVLAGPVVETLAAGARTTTVNGAISQTASAAIAHTAGAAYTVAAGAAISQSSGAAFSITSGAAVSVTAGAVMTLTAPAGIVMTSTNIQLGGPPAVLGVARGVPSLPPGTPTLDYITGLPLLGSAMVRSL